MTFQYPSCREQNALERAVFGYGLVGVGGTGGNESAGRGKERRDKQLVQLYEDEKWKGKQPFDRVHVRIHARIPARIPALRRS